MSRIVALLHRDGRPVERELLAGLAAPMRNRASDGPRFWGGGSAGLAYQCLKTSTSPHELQPVELATGLAICFDGRLDNRAELVGQLAPELASDANGLSDAGLALACYRRFGEGFASRLNGDFALALFDEARRRLVLARDVMGMRPLYFWSSEGTFIAASEIKAILAHPAVDAQPDDEALADALVGGNPNELRLTLFRDVRRVPPGQTVIASPEGITEFQHWDFDPMRQVLLRSPAEYAEALRGLFEQAVRRRLRVDGGVAVMVSGGLDSSAILCQAELLKQAGHRFPAVHGISRLYPEGSAADERRYLDAVESRYPIEIHRIPPAPVRTYDDPAWPWRLEFPLLPSNGDLDCPEVARQLDCDVLLDGFLGDQILWTAAPFYDDLRNFRWGAAHRKFETYCRSMSDCRPRELRSQILHGFARDLAPDALLVPFRKVRRVIRDAREISWYSKAFRNVAYRREQQQHRIDLTFASKHAELCYTRMRSAYISHQLELSNKMAAWHGLERAYPFADRDLVAFVMAIPGDVINGDGTYKALFREAMRGTLPEAIRLRYDKADFTLAHSEATAAFTATGIEDLLDRKSLAVTRGYVDAASLPEALSRTQARLSELHYLPAAQLNELFAFEPWLRAFFGQARP